jgi:hypothetical protein
VGYWSLVAIALFFLNSSLDEIITAVVKKFGLEITQTNTTLKETLV